MLYRRTSGRIISTDNRITNSISTGCYVLPSVETHRRGDRPEVAISQCVIGKTQVIKDTRERRAHYPWSPANVLLRLMGEDINYDSFGFIVIRLMRAGVGYRGECSRRVVRLSPQVHPNARPPESASPSPLSHFHSTHLVSLINFVLWLLHRLAGHR